MAAAVNAFNKSPRQLPDNLTATETEQEAANVIGMHRNR
jgi:hypothetical protein